MALNQSRSPESDFNFYIYDLRRARKSHNPEAAKDVSEHLAQILGLITAQYFPKARQVSELLYATILETSNKVEADKALTDFYDRFPHMKKWKSIKFIPEFPEYFNDEFDFEYEETHAQNSKLLSRIARNAFDSSLEMIKTLIQERNLQSLFHYTVIQNLPEILANGIISRPKLKMSRIQHIANDEYRFDNLPNWISTSVSKPNYATLYSIKQKYPDRKFAILELSANALLELNWIAIPTNAANKLSQTLLSNQPTQTVGYTGLINLFKDGYSRNTSSESPINRDSFNLELNEPTDPQSEIMFEGQIPSNKIFKIHTELDKEELSKIFSKAQIIQMVSKFPQSNWDFKCEHHFNKNADYSWQSRKINPLKLKG